MRAIGTWDRIHELMTTGHTARQVVAIFNRENYRLAQGKPWTVEALKQYRSKYAARFNVDLLSAAYRPEAQCLEIAFFAQMCRVDGYDARQVVDLLNESPDLRHWWYHGRPWTTTMLNNTIYRARSILREIEGADEMSAVVDSIDQRVITAAAVASIDVDAVEESKVEKLRRVAYRCAELRDEGARVDDIINVLNRDFARSGGWDRETLRAVEQYAKRFVAFVGRDRDREVMLSLANRVFGMLGAMTHAQIAERFNAEQVSNEVAPGEQWTHFHTQRLIDYRRRQGQRKSTNPAKQEQEPTTTDQVTGRRSMRKADIAMREHARAQLAMREAAFQRASELHHQIALLQAQLSQAQHIVEQGNEAESILISTGPPQLVEKLNVLKANTSTAINRDDLSNHTNEVAAITARIISEDWR